MRQGEMDGNLAFCYLDWYRAAEIPIIAAFDASASPSLTSRLIRSLNL
ncbi:hypothetical protein CKO_00713 [Citrobacter koseri ATCC BAA-895]|uniref:Uncharacterized protein n=1 Tax=Citrobacter koseri (strain ATCC BAA-895 / CDC 4225-83 / SGSC4696) TaxID=290338 RepID=A8AEF2_CITK8|nr:hypothetical protein CKO_00713 [Citrobacter koseri ATCC BAA-895]